MNQLHPVSWSEGLTGAALAIAEAEDKHLRVIAGPGTGKSYALGRRIMRLLQSGWEPKRILAITFTRTAADQLVKDLNNLGTPGCNRIHAGTLHSFCFQFLLKQHTIRNTPRAPRPILTYETSKSLQFEGGVMLDDLVLDNQSGNKRQCTRMINAFEADWARLQTEDPGWPQNDVDKAFHISLTNWLQFHNTMLIGELVPETLRFLRNNPSTSILTDYDHIVVDEYQDLNRAEQELVQYLGINGSTTVVGDPNQSIYSVKYAHPQGIEAFHERHSDTHDETLSACRRCPSRIVDMANSLIGYNPVSGSALLEKRPGNEEGELHVVQWKTPREEATGIASYITELVKNRGVAPSDILILAPRRFLGYRIRNLLRTAEIPVHSFYHEQVLENANAQRAITVLNLLSHPDDRVSLRWWLGHGSQSGLSKSYQKLRFYCEQYDMLPRDVLEAMRNGEVKIPHTATLLTRYSELRETLSNLKDLAVLDLIDQLLPSTDEELLDLREIALLYANKCNTVSELNDHIKRHIIQPEVPDGGFVRVMSLHKSKGLTSKFVIVTSCNHGIVPYVPYDEDDASISEKQERLEEQRRLFYIAITRSTRVLVLSSFIVVPHSEVRQVNAKLVMKEGYGKATVSQFIAELGLSTLWPQSGPEWAASNYLEGKA